MVLGVLLSLLQGLGMLLFLLAVPAVLGGEEVAAATEQQGAPLLFHITRQKKKLYRAETQTHKSAVIKTLSINC